MFSMKQNNEKNVLTFVYFQFLNQYYRPYNILDKESYITVWYVVE